MAVGEDSAPKVLTGRTFSALNRACALPANLPTPPSRRACLVEIRSNTTANLQQSVAPSHIAIFRPSVTVSVCLTIEVVTTTRVRTLIPIAPYSPILLEPSRSPSQIHDGGAIQCTKWLPSPSPLLQGCNPQVGPLFSGAARSQHSHKRFNQAKKTGRSA